MKIFFIASPRAVIKEPDLFKKIAKVLSKDNKMLGEMVLEWTKGDVEDFYAGTHEERIEHYKKTMDYVKKADVVVVDVSLHSMSMGYIVNKGLEASKPVIALYKRGNDPYFFSGIQDQKLQIVAYDENNVEKVLAGALNNVSGLMDVRFNFFVSPKILNYLDWVAQKRMVPRSVFLRDLIEKEMRKDKEFRQ